MCEILVFFSRMKTTQLSLLYLCTAILFFWYSTAALVYDPITNTYKESTTNSTSTTGSTSTTTGTTATGSTTKTTSTTVVYDPITNTYKSASATGASATTGSSATWTTNSTSSSVKFPDPLSYKWTLAAMHVQLDKHVAAVMNKLSTNLWKLDGNASSSLQQASDRLKTLACLGVITNNTSIYDTLKASANNLENSIQIVAADMHSEISSLEQKIDKKLLDQLIQQLEISSMQNKIDSFLTQYSNVADLFYEVSIGKVEEVEKIFTNLSSDARKSIESYDENNKAYRELMTAYDSFLSKSSFAGVVAWPNINDLVNTTEWLKTYRRSKLLSDWQTSVVAYTPAAGTTIALEEKKKLLQNFSLLFNEKSQWTLGDIYPIDELLLLNKQIIGIRAAYTNEKSGFADCQAFVSNPTVKITSPELQTYMTKLLEKLNSAVNKVATGSSAPKDKAALLAWLKVSLNKETETMIKQLITSHKEKIVEELATKWITFLSFKKLSKNQELEGAVRVYLQKKYLEAITNNTNAAFQEKMNKIATKIEGKLASWTLTSSQTKLLSIIEWIVNEFLE